MQESYEKWTKDFMESWKNLDWKRTLKILDANVKYLILFHTEDTHLETRKQLYLEEEKKYFKKNIFVPNDLEVIDLNPQETNYIILHGSFGSKDGNWFPWLKKQLEHNNQKVDVPQMPTGIGKQTFESWSKVLNELTINDNTIIIAHSIAPIFICKYLITNKIKVKKLIFVCGFNNYLGINKDFDTVNKPMFIDNYDDVKNHCDEIVCYYSDNDPYVKFEVEKDFADTISNRQYLIKDGGHINTESGYTEFKNILQEINYKK